MTIKRVTLIPPDPADVMAMQLRAMISDFRGRKSSSDLRDLPGSCYSRAEALLLRDTVFYDVVEEDTELVQAQ